MIGELGGPYDLIFADAVLLHFTIEDVTKVFDKIRKALRTNGTFSFSVKNGQGTEWSTHKLGGGRFFQYWQSEDLRTLLVKKQFNVLSLVKTHDDKWLHVIARKMAV